MNNTLRIYLRSILIPLLLGTGIGIIISDFIDYNELLLPAFSPSGAIFPIVWTILYTLMGVSYGILKNNNLVDDKINIIYYLQLIINLLWPIAFFIFKLRLFSAIWIIGLLVLVGYMIYEFYMKNKIAGLLQIPYLLWLVFATYLNIGVYILN